MAYSELIKSFHRIRPYMRSFYVYGFKYRREHTAKSARSYDNERRRIESWLGDYLKFSKDAEGKRVFLAVDSRAIAENPLYQAFRAKSFTDMDITLHFLLLDMLDTECGVSMLEVMENLEQNLEAYEDVLLPDESSVRKKLKEYENLGLVRKEKQGQQIRYYLVDNTVDLVSWADALDFFTEVAPLGVIGSYMREDGTTNFRFKHHYIWQALDSEMLYSLFLAMDEGKTALLRNGRMSVELVPLKIYLSSQSGRQYVLGKTKRGLQFFRLDLLDEVKVGQVAQLTAAERDLLQEFQSKLWGTSKKRSDRTEHLEFVIHVEPEENFVVQRLKREKRTGTLTDLGAGNWQFAADVYDVGEMLPWVRTFIGRIVSLKTDNSLVSKRFYDDLQALQQLYGGEADAVL